MDGDDDKMNCDGVKIPKPDIDGIDYPYCHLLNQKVFIDLCDECDDIDCENQIDNRNSAKTGDA